MRRLWNQSAAQLHELADFRQLRLITNTEYQKKREALLNELTRAGLTEKITIARDRGREKLFVLWHQFSPKRAMLLFIVIAWVAAYGVALGYRMGNERLVLVEVAPPSLAPLTASPSLVPPVTIEMTLKGETIRRDFYREFIRKYPANMMARKRLSEVEANIRQMVMNHRARPPR